MSRSKDIAEILGATEAENTTNVSLGTGGGGGTTTFSTVNDLPTSGNEEGDQAFVSGNNRLYIWNGSGWYNIALINTNPSFSTGPDSDYDLSADGNTTTITLLATDPEGLVITYTATSDSDFDGLATVSQDSSVFTITPFSEDSATTTSGTLTFKASDGVNIASVISTFTLRFAIQNSNSTSLLLKATGNNGTNSSTGTLIENSGNTWDTGAWQSHAFSPFHPGGYSVYFDGTDDKLYVDNNSSFEVGSNDFTLEFWYYPQTSNSNEAIAGYYSTTNNQRSYAVYHADTSANLAMVFSTNGSYQSENVTVSSVTPEQMNNKWNHIALTKSGTTAKLWHNGVLVATDTSAPTTLYTPTSGPFNMGTFNETDYIQGYLRDVRLVVGSQVYTSSFIPPSETLTAISGTALLACASPAPLDLSTNNHYIKYNSHPKIERIGPYNYKSTNNYDGSWSASNLFDWDSDLRGSSGDMTVEGWIYNESTSAGFALVTFGTETTNRHTFYWRSASGGVFYHDKYGDYNESIGSASVNDGSELGIFKWSHVALTISGKVVTIYINGRAKGSRTLQNHVPDPVGNGNRFRFAGGGSSNGILFADMRYSNNVAKYTGTFAPPTAPIGSDDDTTVYLRAPVSSNYIYDASGSSSIQLSGDTKSSTAQTKNASSSIVFDGNGDTITLSQQVPRNETDDWTIEFWTRPNNVTNRMDMFTQYDGSTAGRMSINMNNTGILNFFQNGLSPSSISSSSSMSANTWHHVAVTNSGGTRSMWLDGNYQGSSTGSQAIMDSTIMIGNAVDRTDYMNGYMEDIRLTKGLSRYPFTPFQTTLSNDSNTDFLTGHADTIVDGSSNSYTITSNGPAVTNFGPFTGMKSIYFDGSNDTMTVPAAAWDRDADYTVECWMYPTGAHYVAMSRNRQHADGIIFSISSNGIVFLGVGRDNVDSWDVNYTGSKDIRNRWSHLALTYDASEKRYRIFVNGTQVFTDTSAYHPGSLSSDFDIGCAETMNSASNSYGTGWISNHRISNNIRYTTSFTPPTAELTG